MKIPYRPIALVLLISAFSGIVFQRAQAGGGRYFPPVTDAVVKAECSSCHLAFAPSMLPASSWSRMMGDLKNHFGDDASVDADTTAAITRYLVDHAGDARGQPGKLLRGLRPGDAPLRITELPKWVREHRKVPDWEWKHKEVRTRANCTACHVDAAKGYYDE